MEPKFDQRNYQSHTPVLPYTYAVISLLLRAIPVMEAVIVNIIHLRKQYDNK